MEYTGKLYGKVGRRTIPLTMTTEDVDKLIGDNLDLVLQITAAKCTLAKWIEWARMHGHLEHVAGIADETRMRISSENH